MCGGGGEGEGGEGCSPVDPKPHFIGSEAQEN